MKVRFRVMLAGAMALFSVGARAQQAEIHVDTRATGVPVSPLLYGIFFEEINHAGDGGLYAELIRNRSFEDVAAPDGWKLGEPTNGVMLTLDKSRPLNAQNPTALHIDTAGRVSDFPVTLTNGGYWGMNFEKGKPLKFTVFARSDVPKGATLHVELRENRTQGSIAESVVANVGADWKQYTVTLKPRISTVGHLALSWQERGSVWLDSVSLFPVETFKKRSNGLRRDLAQKLLEMRPAFVRFPGGCFVEGARIQNAFKWKQTLGELHTRPGHLNDVWNYRSTDGLGYHEYLQLCEDLSAEPLFVVNCGMAHLDRIPLNELDVWIQDALDAVEYANGAITTKWGAVRAQNGHPKPFGLKYLEIGNENGWGDTLPAYEDRYARFYDALRAKYPEVKLIANVPVKNRPADILDDHFYQSPDWFVTNAGMYDKRDRSAPKIYVGEYAVTQGAGLGNLKAALGEAVWMMGMERNSDVVTMASYAPLFVNVNDRNWNPDAIGFDAAQSFGTPSYYVQQLFAVHRPDVALPTATRSAVEEKSVPTGAVGVGTWRTQAEYRNLKVESNGKTLYTDNFAQGADGWRTLRGKWNADNGVYRQDDARSEDVRAVAGSPQWQNYTLTLQARKLSGAEGFLVMFRVRDDSNWYWWNIGGWNNTLHAVEKMTNGAKSLVTAQTPGSVETGRWYDIKIDVRGNHIQCFLDGKLVHDVEEKGLAPLHSLAGFDRKTGEYIVKVVNYGATPQDTDIILDGVTASMRKQATMLTGTPNAENSLQNPNNIVPKTGDATSEQARFRQTFPPYSLTILRLKPNRN